VPPEKQEVLAVADGKIAELEEQYRDGLITDQEKYKQTIDTWNKATDEVTTMVKSTLDPYGSIYTIANSGATKAKFQQIRQLSGMRGLMASPSGKIIAIPSVGTSVKDSRSWSTSSAVTVPAKAWLIRPCVPLSLAT